MEKYEKPSMDVIDIHNDVITDSCTGYELNNCTGFLGYGGGCSYGNPR